MFRTRVLIGPQEYRVEADCARREVQSVSAPSPCRSALYGRLDETPAYRNLGSLLCNYYLRLVPLFCEYLSSLLGGGEADAKKAARHSTGVCIPMRHLDSLRLRE